MHSLTFSQGICFPHPSSLAVGANSAHSTWILRQLYRKRSPFPPYPLLASNKPGLGPKPTQGDPQTHPSVLSDLSLSIGKRIPLGHQRPVTQAGLGRRDGTLTAFSWAYPAETQNSFLPKPYDGPESIVATARPDASPAPPTPPAHPPLPNLRRISE